MKRWLIALVCLCTLATVSRAQVAVSGNLKNVGVANVTGNNTFVRFSLKNYGSNLPHVVNTNTIVTDTQDFKPDGSGNISGSLQGNDTIAPGGTFYQVCVYYQGNLFRCANYLITGTTFNLNTALPLSSIPQAGPNQLIVQVFPCPVLVASLTWTCNHNFDDNVVWVETFDTNGVQIFPDSVDTSNPNTTVITWVSPQAGSARIMHAGSIQIVTNQPNAVLQNGATGSQSVGGPFPFTFNTQTIFNQPATFNSSVTLALPLTLTKNTFSHTLTAPTLTGARTWTLQDASDTFVFRTTTDTLTNKTLDASLNTLKWSSNTAGHVLRNDGTKYVDAVLGASDLSDGVTGTGAVVRGTSPTIITPVLNGTPTGTSLQGTDPLVLTTDGSGSTGDIWVRDASGGAKSGGTIPIIKTAKNTSICTATGSVHSYFRCGATVTWSVAFADNNYFVACSGVGPSDPTNNPENGRAYVQVLSHSASSVSLDVVATGNSDITWGSIECIGVHP